MFKILAMVFVKWFLICNQNRPKFIILLTGNYFAFQQRGINCNFSSQTKSPKSCPRTEEVLKSLGNQAIWCILALKVLKRWLAFSQAVQFSPGLHRNHSQKLKKGDQVSMNVLKNAWKWPQNPKNMSYILFSVVYGVKKKNKSMKTPTFVFLGQKCPKKVLRISQNYALCASLGEDSKYGRII